MPATQSKRWEMLQKEQLFPEKCGGQCITITYTTEQRAKTEPIITKEALKCPLSTVTTRGPPYEDKLPVRSPSKSPLLET